MAHGISGRMMLDPHDDLWSYDCRKDRSECAIVLQTSGVRVANGQEIIQLHMLFYGLFRMAPLASIIMQYSAPRISCRLLRISISSIPQFDLAR